jgi:hypothetical protein
MDRNELVENILVQAKDPRLPTRATVKFKRPYTIGAIEYVDQNDHKHLGMGLAKVCWPDVWDKKRGANIVLLRAAREIADDIFAREAGLLQEAINTVVEDALEEVLAEGVAEEI